MTCASDSEGLARDDLVGRGRRHRPARQLLPAPPPSPARAGSRVGEVLDGVLAGEEPGVDELVDAARGPRVPTSPGSPTVADQLRRETVGDVVTFVRNRNINYTNVCTFKCRFCAFSKGPLSLNLRGTPYLLELEEIAAPRARGGRLRRDRGVPAGRHPPRLRRRLLPRRRAGREGGRAADPRPRLHRARGDRGRAPARHAACATTSSSPKDAGLSTLPGTAAEILDDEVRAIICPDKVDTEEWLDAHRTAHQVGLRSNITIMFGHVERPVHVARHLVRTRELQKETGGFTEYVPLPVRAHGDADLPAEARAAGPTFREVLLVHAVGRIAYHGLIDNIQASWVKAGVARRAAAPPGRAATTSAAR